jgi:hypothetical protein
MAGMSAPGLPSEATVTEALASEVGVPVVRFRAFLPESRATGTPVVVQEFVAGERASDVWPALDEAQRCHLAGEFGAVVGRLFGAQP